MELKNPHLYSDQKERAFAINISTIILYLIIFAISSMFLALTGAFQYTKYTTDITPIKVPIIFILSTFLLVYSSFSINKTKEAYINDEADNYIKALNYTIISSVLFFISQAFGWNQLIAKNIFLTSSPLASYVYIISILHVIHLFAGLPFLIAFTRKAKKQLEEPEVALLYFSDNEKLQKLNLFRTYWHFLDILWIYLLVFFFVNSIF